MRRQKLCPKCNTPAGPRKKNCSCGYGFVIKGVKIPNKNTDTSVTPKTARSTRSAKDTNEQLWDLVELYDGPDDKHMRNKYQMDGKTWQSKCGRYRVREQLTFMGVSLSECFPNCILLLELIDDKWEIVTPKSRFRTPLVAIRRMLVHSEGRKVKATTYKEKLSIRVAEITNKPHGFAK